ncbi:YARHG domain-containing protein [Cohaesibacter sp. ES.047]|uniref:YARHG domain-containing protein n=1 Tax=Cohaesibacter sp. ES.047 TaxID=1798205 RepID=UPI000BC041BC|nr:YARHG domain-containing protein [Cohaesibacter sp. ES.047]SNY93243.1 YARHG domain-containing protein [Cohaesibacter sp. ES.047]
MANLLSFSRKMLIATGFLLAATVTTVPGTDFSFVSNANAQGYRNMTCGELWYERNAIYAQQGYCFKTRRARQTFGPRCYSPWGRLTASQQRRVNRIVGWERRYGCR